jgi:hypothetical protein
LFLVNFYVGGHSNEFFQEKGENSVTSGIKMKHLYEQMVFKDWDEGDRLYFTDPLSFAIATNADVRKTYFSYSFFRAIFVANFF